MAEIRLSHNGVSRRIDRLSKELELEPMAEEQRSAKRAEIANLKREEGTDDKPYRTGYEEVPVATIVAHFAEVAARESDDQELDDVEDIYWQLNDARHELERRGE